MKRSFAGFAALLILAGCAKDKGVTVATSPEGALSSSQHQCASLACQTVEENKNPKKPSPVPQTDPKPEPKPEPKPDPKPEPEVLNDTQKMAKNASLKCKDGDCDPSVGLLSIVLKNEVGNWSAGQCTASLIGPDLLVTNGHCIPSDLVAAGSDCTNRMWITFADDPAHPEYTKQVRCSKVLFRKKDSGMDGADYAYLQLDQSVNRPALRQTRAGFENNKQYQLHKINPSRVTGGISGLFEKVSCLSLYDSAIFPTPLDSQSETNFFVDCRVIPGNSGSPILADDGSVRGVIYAFVKKEQIRGIFAKNGSKLPEEAEISDLNVGSNFACLLAPNDPEGRELPPSCANTKTRIAEKRAAADAKKVLLLKPQARKLIDSKKGSKRDILAFGWSLSLSNSEKLGPMGLGVPECVKAATAKASLNQNIKIQRPFFFVRADYDKYMRASNLGLVWGGFSTAPEQVLIKEAGGGYSVNITDPDSGQTQFGAELAACAK